MDHFVSLICQKGIIGKGEGVVMKSLNFIGPILRFIYIPVNPGCASLYGSCPHPGLWLENISEVFGLHKYIPVDFQIYANVQAGMVVIRFQRSWPGSHSQATSQPTRAKVTPLQLNDILPKLSFLYVFHVLVMRDHS